MNSTSCLNFLMFCYCRRCPYFHLRLVKKVQGLWRLYNLDVYTILSNLAGIPAISIPAGFSKEGLPIGLQLLSNEFNEQMLIDIATFFENKG